MKAETLMVGIGNPYRRDDAAGVRIVRDLGRHLAALQHPVRADTLECCGEGTELMSSWEGYQRVYVFDAVQSRARPGRIHHLRAEAADIPADFFHYSSHAFSLAEAVELARALGRLPPTLTVFGVEGADFSHGEGLSAPVLAACRTVVDQVLNDLAADPAVAAGANA